MVALGDQGLRDAEPLFACRVGTVHRDAQRNGGPQTDRAVNALRTSFTTNPSKHRRQVLISRETASRDLNHTTSVESRTNVQYCSGMAGAFSFFLIHTV